MPKQDFNSGSGTKGPHRQGEKGGKGGELEKAGRSAGDGKGKDGNKQIGPFDQRDKDKRPRVSSDVQESGGSMRGER